MANTGMAYGDAQAVADALIALLEGEPSAPVVGTALAWADAVLLLLTALTAAATWRGVRRSRHWARRGAERPSVAVMRLLPLAPPILLLAAVHRIVGFLYRGRDVAWIQVSYLYPTLMTLLAVAALGCALLAVVRVVALVRERGRTGHG
ncbi:hypothetical protein [Nocardiopsis sp. CNR-923]|uniref:hypothetical protein n=1 Tax=Nocardiopsis sp. CNR-923 TaxID=1904965 RepID=UPI0021CD00A1|nr:hypothetical protein [Nocardiopsis sp. CNR-923]